MVWQSENAGEDQGQAVTKAVAALVENMLAREERRAVRATAAPVSKEERQVEILHTKVEAALRFLDGLGKEGRAQLAHELQAKEAHAGTIIEVRQLQEELRILLLVLGEA